MPLGFSKCRRAPSAKARQLFEHGGIGHRLRVAEPDRSKVNAPGVAGFVVRALRGAGPLARYVAAVRLRLCGERFRGAEVLDAEPNKLGGGAMAVRSH